MFISLDHFFVPTIEIEGALYKHPSVTAAAGSNVRDIATSVNAVFDSTGVAAIASTQLKLEAKSLDDTYNGQNSISFSLQGKNTTATTISANITLNHVKTSSVLSDLRDSINNFTKQ